MRTLPTTVAAFSLIALAGCDKDAAPTSAPPTPTSTTPTSTTPATPTSTTPAGPSGPAPRGLRPQADAGMGAGTNGDADIRPISEAFRAAGVAPPDLFVAARFRWGPLAGFRVEARSAKSEWERLRAVTAETGYFPLILVEHSEWLEGTVLNDREERAPSVEERIRFAESIDAEAWLASKQGEGTQDGVEVPRGEWSGSPQKEPLALRDYQGNWREEVLVVLIPTREAWKVPLYLAWGGWNACPEDVVHAAVFKRWGEIYGAELMLMRGDILEARVSRPPLERSRALELANEQFWYCPDIVEQGVETLDALGASVLNAGLGFWYFWWD